MPAAAALPVQHLTRGTKEGQKRLLYWVVEDAVKRRYNMLVTALEECTRDNLEFIKDKATKVWGCVEAGWVCVEQMDRGGTLKVPEMSVGCLKRSLYNTLCVILPKREAGCGWECARGEGEFGAAVAALRRQAEAMLHAVDTHSNIASQPPCCPDNNRAAAWQGDAYITLPFA